MIAPGSVSHSLAIDFDIDDGFDVGMRLARRMAEHDISSYVETSRREYQDFPLLHFHLVSNVGAQPDDGSS